MAYKRPPYTMVPHELIDIHLKDLSGSEVKVVLAIIRATCGWHRDTWAMSLSEIAEVTGLSSGSCSDAAASLAAKNLIIKHRQKTDTGGHAATVYEPAFEAPPFSTGRGAYSVEREAPSRQADNYKEERKQEVKIEESSPTPSLEIPTRQELLNQLRSIKGIRLTPKIRREVLECPDEILQGGLSEAVECFVKKIQSRSMRWSKKSTKHDPQPVSYVKPFPAPKVGIAISNEWQSDAKYGQYLFELARTGRRVSVQEARDAFKIWQALANAQKDLSIEDIKYLVVNASEYKFVPGPVKHLSGEPWEALRMPAAPRNGGSKNERALEIALDRQARRERGEWVL